MIVNPFHVTGIFRYPQKTSLVAKNHGSIQCNKCNISVHRNFNKINKQTYRLLQKKNSHCFCIIFTKDFLPFSELNNDEFVHTIKDKKIKFTHVTKKTLAAEAGFFQQINSYLDANLTNTIYQAISNKLKWM